MLVAYCSKMHFLELVKRKLNIRYSVQYRFVSHSTLAILGHCTCTKNGTLRQIYWFVNFNSDFTALRHDPLLLL